MSLSNSSRYTCSHASYTFEHGRLSRREGALPPGREPQGPAPCTPWTLKASGLLLLPSLSGRSVITQAIPEKEKTKVTLVPPLSLLIERTQGLSGPSRACFRNGICADYGAPIAFLMGAGISLGPLQCFQGKVRTFVTIPGSRPARDLGLHSPLASRGRDAPEAGPHQLFAGCPERAYFGNNTARFTVASSRASPPAAAAAPARASRHPPQPGERAGGRGPGGVGSHLLGKWGEESCCSWGPGKGWAAGVWGDHEVLERWGAGTGCGTLI